MGVWNPKFLEFGSLCKRTTLRGTLHQSCDTSSHHQTYAKLFYVPNLPKWSGCKYMCHWEPCMAMESENILECTSLISRYPIPIMMTRYFVKWPYAWHRNMAHLDTLILNTLVLNHDLDFHIVPYSLYNFICRKYAFNKVICCEVSFLFFIMLIGVHNTFVVVVGALSSKNLDHVKHHVTYLLYMIFHIVYTGNLVIYGNWLFWNTVKLVRI